MRTHPDHAAVQPGIGLSNTGVTESFNPQPPSGAGTGNGNLEQPLQPDEQMWIDLGKLIRESILDKNGKTLPNTLTSGSYEIRDLTNKGIGTLFEGKVIYDKTYGHVTYGCTICCAFKRLARFSNPLNMLLNGTASDGVNGLDSCSLEWTDISGDFDGDWTTANPSIATVDCCGTFTGQGAGSTTSSTFADEPWYISQYSCPIMQRNSVGTDDVGPYQVEPISTKVQGAASCPTGMQGWSRTVQNQLQYASGAGYLVAGITMADTISIGSTNDLGVNKFQTGSYATDSNGSWPDTYYVCSTACPSSGQTIALQTWTFNQTPLAHSDSLVYKCAQITIDGH